MFGVTEFSNAEYS